MEKRTGRKFVGGACAPFLCPGYLVRGAHPTKLKWCVGQSFFVGAALRGRPPPGTYIGVPLRLLQGLLATSSLRCEFFCFLPLCTN